MGTKKQLKRILAVVRSFPQEKWLIDRIVELTTRKQEENLRRQLRETSDRLTEQIVCQVVKEVVEQVGRHFPSEEQVRKLVREEMAHALQDAEPKKK